MNKRGRLSKIIVMIAVGLVIALAVFGVFARAENTSSSLIGDNGLTSAETSAIDKKVDAVATSGIADEVKSYVEDFAGKRDVQASQINNISQVDFNSLPKEVNIENVNDANLAIYQVNYNETNNVNATAGSQKNLFVITYSTEQLKAQGDIIIASDKRGFLNFGSVDAMSSGFLKTATGVSGSLEAGYVMIREGSITGISTNLDVIAKHSGANVEIVVYKNGKSINFGNTMDGSGTGLQTDYDVQSNGVVTFQPGDVISAYAKVTEGSNVKIKSVITMVEITTK